MQSKQATVFLLTPTRILGSLATLAILFLFSADGLLAQRNRVNQPIDNARRVLLRGHVNPKANPQDDQGRVDPATTLPYVTLMLKQTDAQQADLTQLLAQQQDPASPNYHHWLTPEQYADRFGVSQDDLKQIVTWLQAQHLNIAGVARARNWVSFSGPAGQIESAFGTEIHSYLVDGKQHFANVTNPSVPAAFDNLVGEIHGLNDFRLHPPRRQPLSIQPALQPNYTSSKGNHYLAPDDVAAIYNIQPLYNAGIDGSGQKIAVVGQTQVDLSDITQFRTYFNLPGGDPQTVLVPNTRDPGISSNDLPEADLDIEWSGAIARNASIIYVYSYDVMDAVQYAIDQNLAPVVSMSYGLCESLTSTSEAQAMQSWARQGNAQGMTWITASGDSGAADCVASSTRTNFGLTVDMPASLPEVTGIGGTTFNEGNGTYWNAANNGNHASVLSYIPEGAWNDSIADGSPSATGGGASAYFSKPSWQTGNGVPTDGARDVPDVSLSASADHDGYLVYTGGALQVFGGTSVGAPSFAGIATLLNQYLVSNGYQSNPGLGNMNPRLYSIAQSAPSAFHDVTTGDNMVNPCPSRARSCDPTPIGFSAAPGYDLVTGLGSVDAYALVTSWHLGAAISKGNANLALASNTASVTLADTATLIATVASTNGGTPTGSVTFSVGSTSLGTVTLSSAGGGTATATLAVNGAQLVAGVNTFTAQYSGDAAYNSATTSFNLRVTAIQTGPPSITGLANGASFRQAFAPGMILSVFGSQLSQATGSAPSLPLPGQMAGVSAAINGVAAPLYYISPGQLNIQIPYETPTSGSALLTINNNGQTVTSTLAMSATAPGIFTDQSGAPVPFSSASRGQVITMYITGEGAVTPALATGATPPAGTATSNLPKPRQSVTVTVGGADASVQFIGIPPGLAGVTQINFQVPANATLGTQPLAVTVGGVASPTASLRVTQ